MTAATKEGEVEGLKTQLNDTFAEIKKLVSEQDAQIKANGEATHETGRKLDEVTARSDEIKAELNTRLDELEAEHKRITQSTPEAAKTAGEVFIESDAYKAFKDNNYNGHTAPVPFDRKLLDSTPLSATGNLYGFESFRVPGVITPAERTDRVRSLFPVIPTTNASIEYVRETGFTNAAAPVAEGAAKPESDINFEVVQDGMKTIAHYVKATRQIIADWPALQGYINTRLLNGIDLVEDSQILYGTGVGANMRGLLSAGSGVQTYLWSSGPNLPAGDDRNDTKLDAIRRAMTMARVAEYPVSGVVLHPDDWEDIELIKASDGKYIWTTVTNGGQQRVWRTPVVDTTAITTGTALTGAFAMGAAIWDREQSTIRIADQHASDFTSNLFTILAEERLGLSIYRPEAFVSITFDSAPAAAV